MKRRTRHELEDYAALGWQRNRETLRELLDALDREKKLLAELHKLELDCQRRKKK